MTNSLFFDTDCLSAFLWVKEESLLAKLYPGQVVIPQQVYDEITAPSVLHLKARVDDLLHKKQVSLAEIMVDTEAYNLYYQLTVEPKGAHTVIGKGEASAIVLAKFNDGIIASNNLRDIVLYIKEFGLRHMTTGDILIEACKRGYLTEDEGNTLWAEMLSKRRKLGAKTFTDYLKSKNAQFAIKNSF